MEPTTINKEIAEQENWSLKSEFQKFSIFDKYIENEFIPEKQTQANENNVLSRLIQYAVQNIPFYRKRYDELDIDASSILNRIDLQKLPTIDRALIRQHYSEFQNSNLPNGEVWAGTSTTSGRSSELTYFRHTRTSRVTGQITIQRQYRWHRWNPMSLMGIIYKPSKSSGTFDSPKDKWLGMGKYFHTAPITVVSSDESQSEIVNWIKAEKPEYIRAWPATFEQLAFFMKRSHGHNVKGVRVAGGMLTDAMETRINSTFASNVMIGYGLDELGWIASRCPEGKRYHVNSENYLIEIVDKNNRPCKPGEYGRILITTLNNLGMPLIRLETKDSAKVAKGPCLCGRTLPSFDGPIYPDINFLKLESNERQVVHATLDSISLLPDGLCESLNKYQLVRESNNNYTLFLSANRSSELERHLYSQWDTLNKRFKTELELKITFVTDIIRNDDEKFLVYKDNHI